MTWLSDLAEAIRDTSREESVALAAISLHREYLPDSPAQACAITLYGIQDDSAAEILGMQFRFRAESVAQLDTIEDAIRSVWKNRPSGTLGGVEVVQAQWSSGASLGQDSKERPMRSVNYLLTVSRD